jgi:hypothetical protein
MKNPFKIAAIAAGVLATGGAAAALKIKKKRQKAKSPPSSADAYDHHDTPTHI